MSELPVNPFGPGDWYHTVRDFPEIQGSRFTFWLGLVAPILLPLVFLIAWLIIWSQASPPS